MKWLPVSVTVNACAPTVPVEGESEASVAGGWRSVTERLCELPPPGAGLETVKLKLPAGARRAAGATAVSWVALTNVVVSGVLPVITTEDELKFVPVKAKIASNEPA